MIKTYTRPQTPKSFKRPYIIVSDISTLYWTIYGMTTCKEFNTVAEARQYAKQHAIDKLPDSEFYDWYRASAGALVAVRFGNWLLIKRKEGICLMNPIIALFKLIYYIATFIWTISVKILLPIAKVGTTIFFLVTCFPLGVVMIFVFINMSAKSKG